MEQGVGRTIFCGLLGGFLSLVLFACPVYSADSGVDFRAQDDITALGEEGSLNDADLEVEGNTTAQRQVHINTEGLSTPFGGIGTGQNLLYYSEALDNAQWSASNMSVLPESDSSIYAPDGQDGTAEVLTNNGSSGGYIYQTVSSGVSGSTDYVFSVWLRAGTSTSVEIKIADDDSQENTYSTTGLDDKWKRYEVALTTGSSATTITVTITNNGDDTETIYAWGAQLEEGEHAGVYVKTESSAVSQSRGAIINNDVRLGNGTFNNASASADIYVTGNLEVDGTIYGTLANVDSDEIHDNDNDTKVQVEESNDEDYIRFDTAGTERMTIDNNGNVSINGDTTLGDAGDDTLTVNGRISQESTGNSVFLGEGAGTNDDLTDNANIFIGYRAGYYTTSAGANIAIGYRALQNNTTAGTNIAIGYESLYYNDTGHENTGLGYYALYHNTSGERNLALGVQALNDNTTGSYNTAVGWHALYENTTGRYNTAVGNGALQANTEGEYNTAMGEASLYSNTTGDYNVGFGDESLYSNTVGGYNSAFGQGALYANTSGWNNTAVGTGAGDNITTGSSNIMIGTVEADSATADSQLNIGNTIKGAVITGFDAVEYYDGSSFTDDTTESKTTNGTAYTILSTTSDYFYIGMEHEKFNQVYFDLETAGAGVTLEINYYNGSTWGVSISSVSDGTSNLSQDGLISFTAPSDWLKTTIDGKNYYWIRLHTTSSPSTAPTGYLTVRTADDRLKVYANESDSNPALKVDKTGNVVVAGEGTFELQGNARHTRIARISPEYPNVVFVADGTNNSGTLSSGMDTQNNYYYSYYKWSTSQTSLQDYDIYLRWQVPMDFDGFSSGTNDALIVDIATATTTATDNAVDVTLYEDGTTTSTSDTDNVSTSAGTWMTDQEGTAVIAFDDSDTVLSGLSAGDVLVIKLTLKANNTNSGWAKAGAIRIKYLSKW